eukprot:229131_1
MILPLVTIAIAINWRIAQANGPFSFGPVEADKQSMLFGSKKEMELKYLRNYVKIDAKMYRFEKNDDADKDQFKEMRWGVEPGGAGGHRWMSYSAPDVATHYLTKVELETTENKAWRDLKRITWFTWNNLKPWSEHTVVGTFKRELNPFATSKKEDIITLTYNDGLHEEIKEELPGRYYDGDAMTTHPIKIYTPGTFMGVRLARPRLEPEVTGPYTWLQTGDRWGVGWCLGKKERLGTDCVHGEKIAITTPWEAMINLLNQKYREGATIEFHGKEFSQKATRDGKTESSFPFIIRDSHEHGYWNALMIGGFACAIIVVVFCVGIAFGVVINWGYTQKKVLDQQKKRKQMHWLDDQNNDEV